LKKPVLESQVDQWVKQARDAYHARLARDNAMKNKSKNPHQNHHLPALVTTTALPPAVVASNTSSSGNNNLSASDSQLQTTAAAAKNGPPGLDLLTMAAALGESSASAGTMSSAALANYVALKTLEKTAENLKQLLRELIERP